MSGEKMDFEELRERLERSEAILKALRRGEINMIAGETESRVAHSKSLLKEQERMALEWKTTFDAVNDVIWLLDPEHRIIRCNEAAGRLFRRPRTELVGKHCWEIVHGTTQAVPECPLLRASHSLHREAMELEIEGRWFLITVDPLLNASGNCIGAVHIMTDINDRKRAEEALRESEMNFKAVTENAYDGIIVAGSGGIHLYANKRAAELTGYSIKELLEVRMQDLAHPDELPKLAERLKRRLAGEEVTRQYETAFSDKEGKKVPIEMTGAKMLWHGQFADVIIFRDISERKQAEEEQMNLNRQLVQAQKLESVGRLAGGVAHDFNNLLSIILGYSEMALAKLQLQDPFYREIEQIFAAGKRASDLTRQLLAFSRKQTLQPEILNLNTVVQDIEKMLRQLIGEDIALELSLAEDLAAVEVDPIQIEQVIMNLLVNARDAMPLGGKLIIETKNTVLDEAYSRAHEHVKPGPYVLLAVTDMGYGIEKDILPHIFEPFFTTKEKGKGTGLGLSTVYGIVKQSGGNIWAYSEPGKGTTFKIYLPEKEAVPVTKRVRTDQTVRTGNGEHILLVEDEPALKDLIKIMLGSLGYVVTVAANGAEALALIKEKDLRPDLLLTDMVMPGISGSELAKQLRQRQPGLKVIYMSGYTENSIARYKILDPDTPFIPKPMSMFDLSHKVKEALGNSDFKKIK